MWSNNKQILVCYLLHLNKWVARTRSVSKSLRIEPSDCYTLLESESRRMQSQALQPTLTYRNPTASTSALLQNIAGSAVYKSLMLQSRNLTQLGYFPDLHFCRWTQSS